MDKIRPIRRLCGYLLLAASLALLAATFWPAGRQRQQVSSDFAGALEQAPGIENPQIAETRLLTIEWPQAIRKGDADLVRLSFEVDPEGRITPQVETGGTRDDDELIDIPDLYDTHNLVLEARLDLAGMQVAPHTSISEPLRRGQALTFYWSISPSQPGIYRGTLWVYLNLAPKGGGELERVALVAHRLEIEGRSVLGLPAWLARWGAAIGAVLGFLFSMPFFEDILRKVWQRLRT
ncbi:MAG: hypothetical protein ROW39_05575 [Anaerolineaceae bacterium]|jgi:hypothetical protein